MAAMPPNIAAMLAGGQGGPPQGAPQPQAPPPPPPPRSPYTNTYTQVSPEIYEVDPLVLSRPCKIKVLGSSRMLSRDRVAQAVQFLGPIILSAGFMEQMAANGQTIDTTEFERMVSDASGTADEYHLFRPLTPQEQQARQQPPPQVNAQLQAKQLEAQTRTQIMQMKLQGDAQTAQVAADAKANETQEKSAIEILKLMIAEKTAAMQGPRPEELQMELMSKRAELQHQQATQQMALQGQAAKQQLDLQAMRQKTQHEMAAKTAMMLLGGGGGE